jgi:hypothetical protein
LLEMTLSAIAVTGESTNDTARVCPRCVALVCSVLRSQSCLVAKKHSYVTCECIVGLLCVLTRQYRCDLLHEQLPTRTSSSYTRCSPFESALCMLFKLRYHQKHIL